MDFVQRISIISISYNRPKEFLALITSIAQQTNANIILEEVLLMNNGSTEDYTEAETFMEQHPEIPWNYIKSPINHGVSGRNILFKQAKAPNFLVLDDDIEFLTNDVLQNMQTILNDSRIQENNVGILSFEVFYYDTKERQKTAFPHKKYQEYVKKDWFLTNIYIGCAILIKKEVFDKVGYYPNDFFYGMEEYDFGYRAIRAGYTLAYDNRVRVHHKESPYGRVTSEQKIAMMWINKSKVAYRYLPKIYFYTTAIMWSLEYLKKTKFNLKYYVNNWKQILIIPSKESQNRIVIDKKGLNYLDKTEARLWY